MAQPKHITEAWETLAANVHTEDEPTPDMVRVATALEDAGLRIHFIAGRLIAEADDVDDLTGQADGVRFVVEQVA